MTLMLIYGCDCGWAPTWGVVKEGRGLGSHNWELPNPCPGRARGAKHSQESGDAVRASKLRLKTFGIHFANQSHSM